MSFCQAECKLRELRLKVRLVLNKQEVFSTFQCHPSTPAKRHHRSENVNLMRAFWDRSAFLYRHLISLSLPKLSENGNL